MRFLVDAQLPPALSAFLVDRGHQAEHVQDIGLGEAEDLTLWNYAMGCGASIITKDDDFVTRVSLGFPGPVIVGLRVGNCSNRALVWRWCRPWTSERNVDSRIR